MCVVHIDVGGNVICDKFVCPIPNVCWFYRCDGVHCHYQYFCRVCENFKDCNINIFDELKGEFLK